MEDWFHASILEKHVDRATAESRVVPNMLRLLDVLDERGAKATVFVLGRVAERYPELVREVASRGHEIASHGYDHRLVYTQTESEFEDDILKSIDVIQASTGIRPVGYRAPSWSITDKSLWALNVLARNGFAYDSSIFPFKTFLYGIPTAPRVPFRIRIGGTSLLEFPPSVIPVAGATLPFSGGVYFRFLPYAITRRCFSSFAEKQETPAVFYTHPWEFDLGAPRVIGLSLLENLIHYAVVSRMQPKLKSFLGDFEFVTFRQYMESLPSQGQQVRVVSQAQLLAPIQT